jgi:hypothetical protein
MELGDLTLNDLRLIDQCYRRKLRQSPLHTEIFVDISKEIGCDVSLVQVMRYSDLDTVGRDN